MRYEVIFAPEAVKDVQQLKPYIRPMVRDTIEECLRFAPTQLSKSRIKKLQGISRPQFRLRVGDIRVFYDVTESTVEILAVVWKSESAEWLRREGVSE